MPDIKFNCPECGHILEAGAQPPVGRIPSLRNKSAAGWPKGLAAPENLPENER